jgi:hypothetical protein
VSAQRISPTSQPIAIWSFEGARIADSSSTNAVNFSSARTTKRFPSLRCALTIHLVSPLEPIAETQPKLQPALLRLSAMLPRWRPMKVEPDNAGGVVERVGDDRSPQVATGGEEDEPHGEADRSGEQHAERLLVGVRQSE